eukprot:3036217-Rhodomonas_salina.2
MQRQPESCALTSTSSRFGGPEPPIRDTEKKVKSSLVSLLGLECVIGKGSHGRRGVEEITADAWSKNNSRRSFAERTDTPVCGFAERTGKPVCSTAGTGQESKRRGIARRVQMQEPFDRADPPPPSLSDGNVPLFLVFPLCRVAHSALHLETGQTTFV